jgi:LmbE family N-acetylglucosaminyl deacetylase
MTIMTVHAHPDDEVVFTGGTLLLYHDRGVRTVVVTATGGEEGEIHDPDLDPDEARPRLRDIRQEELRRAIEILRVDHLENLGYRDSGMAGTEANARTDNFHNADRDEATKRLVAIVRRYRPQVLITYDENGAYGHPDHIACNVLTQAAYEKAGDPAYAPEVGEPWAPAKLYYTHWPEDKWEEARQMFKERGLKWPWDEEEQQRAEADPEHVSDEEALAEHAEEVHESKEEGKPPEYVPPPVTTRIDVRSVYSQKRDATFVHRTQFAPDGLFKTMPEDIGALVFGEEHYSLVKSRVPAPDKEDDLLAGLT